MSLLTVEDVSHNFGDRQLFKNVSFRLLDGEHVGFVGANGAGKSTLMNILTGTLLKDSGRVEWTPRVRYGYLDQHTNLAPGKTVRDVLKDAFLPLLELEKEMMAITDRMGKASPEELELLLEQMGEIQEQLDIGDFYLIDVKVEEMGNGLGLSAIGLDRDVASLSGGQRTKVLLAKLLLEKPNVLLLDEPTNYLDVEHIDWLTNYLKQYPYAFMLISHDTEFMNKVVNVVYHLEFGKLTRYTANYEKFLDMAEMNKNQHIEAYEKQREFIKKQEDFIQKNKARASTSGRAKSREKQLDRIERIDRPEEAAKPSFSFKESRSSGKTVFEGIDFEIGYDRPLLPKLNMMIERGDKIAIVGSNGVGKSTLLKTILGVIPPISGKTYQGDYLNTAYFQQEVKAANVTPIDDVWNEFRGLTQNEVRGHLARCGLKNEHITRPLSMLSGGEQAKVRLCKLMMRESNWILFDEPTNHLDIIAKAELKRALQEYKGTVLLVSHEPEFYEDWVTKTWNVEQWSAQRV
ncbi:MULTISPECIES: ABC-F family ATP-binding cassette domain-containing protein [unclassified Paenibacillus]|uniref:ABC-F family ATP-binding cassette domain-containing protein n=1 Tax=unclassified Paenibacillus TaxID=185978 RepID=UPI0024063A87|nr:MULTISPECIES: ABC-F family ATP-binding cassette domain-containing protein [unclassified Paenibacillus]MDF9841084.1 ATPase subunit of ABC transporter with duplicated ATPase domains [Paenibacillus sp. PastF-2]MDF9847744.1 ATPase subunit of ABC transporter with duplicated ATPase domains [Paenibacillus sp. PastM-2]MDF9854313.1 ATPase subunit of ABC transporter with duplicated ATPase domains [Paenibacillus sp. PastF-1]MDH6479516.1 ATPase subunit of ABC transporter with duplicated ATPase domains [